MSLKNTIYTLLFTLATLLENAKAADFLGLTQLKNTISPNGNNTNVGVSGKENLVEVIQSFIKWGLTFTGFIAVILAVYSGFEILTSSGDEDKMKKARERIIYAIIGVVVMVFAYTIVRFIADGIITAGDTATTP